MKLRSFEATVKPEHLPDIIKQKKMHTQKKNLQKYDTYYTSAN